MAGGHSGVCSPVLSHRFQIQDLIAQDLSGVTFRALDVETGVPVAVRRFFPFGVDGGGLFDEERSSYDVAVARLAGLKHPGLRAVLTGGCDPVDGMPFVVTEWITGQALADKLEHGVFSPAAAIRVLDRALEISEALSRVLGEEAVWVETTASLIIEDSGESGRGLTFSISPMKWLGGETTRRSLVPVAELAEDLLGWRGMMVADQAGNGLGMWVKWVRAHPETITLFEARQSLASFTGGAAPEPAATIVQAPPTPVPVAAPASWQWLVWVIGLLVVVVAAAGWWMLKLPAGTGTAGSPPGTGPAPQVPVRGGAPATPQSAAATRTAESKRLEEINALAATLVQGGRQAQGAPEAKPGRVFQSGETQAIMNERDREVTVEGVLKNIRSSDSGKSLYLEFEETTPKEEVRGYIKTKNAGDDMSEQALKELLGKRIRISGAVRIMHYVKSQWPEVVLVDRKAIQEVK